MASQQTSGHTGAQSLSNQAFHQYGEHQSQHVRQQVAAPPPAAAAAAAAAPLQHATVNPSLFGGQQLGGSDFFSNEQDNDPFEFVAQQPQQSSFPPASTPPANYAAVGAQKDPTVWYQNQRRQEVQFGGGGGGGGNLASFFHTSPTEAFAGSRDEAAGEPSHESVDSARPAGEFLSGEALNVAGEHAVASANLSPEQQQQLQPPSSPQPPPTHQIQSMNFTPDDAVVSSGDAGDQQAIGKDVHLQEDYNVTGDSQLARETVPQDLVSTEGNENEAQSQQQQQFYNDQRMPAVLDQKFDEERDPGSQTEDMRASDATLFSNSEQQQQPLLLQQPQPLQQPLLSPQQTMSPPLHTLPVQAPPLQPISQTAAPPLYQPTAQNSAQQQTLSSPVLDGQPMSDMNLDASSNRETDLSDVPTSSHETTAKTSAEGLPPQPPTPPSSSPPSPPHQAMQQVLPGSDRRVTDGGQTDESFTPKVQPIQGSQSQVVDNGYSHIHKSSSNAAAASVNPVLEQPAISNRREASQLEESTQQTLVAHASGYSLEDRRVPRQSSPVLPAGSHSIAPLSSQQAPMSTVPRTDQTFPPPLPGQHLPSSQFQPGVAPGFTNPEPLQRVPPPSSHDMSVEYQQDPSLSHFQNRQHMETPGNRFPPPPSSIEHCSSSNVSMATVPDQQNREDRHPSAFHDPRRTADQWSRDHRYRQQQHYPHEPYMPPPPPPPQPRYRDDRSYYNRYDYHDYGYYNHYNRDPYNRDYYDWHHHRNAAYYGYNHRDQGPDYYDADQSWRDRRDPPYQYSDPRMEDQQHDGRQWENDSDYQTDLPPPPAGGNNEPVLEGFNNDVSSILPSDDLTASATSAFHNYTETNAQPTYDESMPSYAQGYDSYAPADTPWQPVTKTPSPPARKTPATFSRPHVVARFGIGGQLVLVLPALLASDKPRPVEITTLKREESDENLLVKFPGPLLREETSRAEVIEYALDCAKNCRNDDPTTSSGLLWEYLALLCRQNGKVEGGDISDLLTRQSQMEGNLQQMLTQPRVSESDVQIAEQQLRTLLLAGRKKQALDLAVKKHLWGHAFMLASRMEARVQAGVANRFVESCERNDPLQTFYVMASGKQPLVARGCADASYGDWKVHLGMMIANKGADESAKNIVSMAQTLASRDVFASHLCYLVANYKPGFPYDERSRVCLLGVDHYGRSMSEYATHEAIQRTEVFEYGCSLADSYFCIPSLQIFKFLYLCDLLDMGFASKALRYCEAISHFVALKPSQFQPAFLYQLHELALRLHCSDVHASSLHNDELPDWILRLGDISQKRQDGSIPYSYPSQPSRPLSVLSGALSDASGHQTPIAFAQKGETSELLRVPDQQQHYVKPAWPSFQQQQQQPPQPQPQPQQQQHHNFVLDSRQESGTPVQSLSTTGPLTQPPPVSQSNQQQANAWPLGASDNQPGSSQWSGEYRTRYDDQQQQQYDQSGQGHSQFNPAPAIFSSQQANDHLPYGETVTDGFYQPPQQSRTDSTNWNSSPMESGQETTREDQQSSQPLTSTSTEGKEAKEAKEAKKEDIDEKTQKQKQSSGSILGRIWRKIAPGSGQAHLPPDKDKSIYWDEKQKRWIDKAASEDEASGLTKAPPTDAELHKKGVTGTVPTHHPPSLQSSHLTPAPSSSSSHPGGEEQPKSGPPSSFSLFSRTAQNRGGRLHARSKYVDVLNPSSGSGGARKLASAPGPPLPIPAQSFTGSIFVPQSDVTANDQQQNDQQPQNQQPTLFSLASGNERTGAQTPDRMSEVSEYSQEVRQHMGYGKSGGSVPLYSSSSSYMPSNVYNPQNY